MRRLVFMLAAASLLPAAACERRQQSAAPEPVRASDDETAEPDPPPSKARLRLEALLEADPDNGGILYVLARSAAGRGATEVAEGYLERLGALESWDYALNPADFGALADTAIYAAVEKRLLARAPSVTHGRVAMELDRVDLLPEGVGWDPKRRELLIGSMYERAVYAADEKGTTRLVVQPKTAGLLGVLGMAVDHERDAVWVVGVGAPFVPELTADEAGQGGVWGFSLGDGSVVGKAVGPYMGLNDLTMLEDGRIVATEAAAGTLLVRDPSSDTLTPALPEDTFLGPNGIERGTQPGIVYVADFLGVHRVDLDSDAASVTLLEAPTDVATLGGIDGLARSGQTLVGVQNLFGAGRIWAIELDDTGTSIDQARILDDAHPRLGGPTTGAFVDASRFWYMGNASLQFGPNGLTPAGPDDKHVILEATL